MEIKGGGVRYLSAAVLSVVCCGAAVYGVMPFGTPMYCALACFSLPAGVAGLAFIAFLSPVYALCSFLFTFEVWRLYPAVAAVFLALVRWSLGLRYKRMNTQAVRALFSLAAVIADTCLSALFVFPVNAVLSGFIGGAFLYFAVAAAGCVMRNFSVRPNVIECASGCVTLAVFGLTLGRAQVGGFFVGLGVGTFTVLMLCAIGGRPALAGGIAVGLGLAFNAPAAAALAFISGAGVATAFRSMPRPVYALIGLGAFAGAAALFGLPACEIGLDCAMSAAGGALFCLLPGRAVRYVRAYFDFDGSARLAVRHYINRIKSDAGNRILGLASVFDETARLISGMEQPPPDRQALGASLSGGICPYCERRNMCDRAQADEAFAKVAERAYSGKPVITDMPTFFTRSCKKNAEVITAAGAMTESARERQKRDDSDSRARAIVCERLVAVKDVLEELGESEALPVGFDGGAESRIKAELALYGAECAEAFVTRDGVTAVLRTESADSDRLRRAVSACMKRRYAVSSLERTQAAGWSVATLKRQPKYEAVYARAGVSKSGGISGDSYSFRRIGDRFLTALIDGMGSGERAGADSAAAVELIECFYRAGFDSAAALAGANRFLKLPGGENFSAADIVVCGLDDGAADIIKLGAPPCYIKTADTVLRIEGSALPIGVLDEMRPYTVRKRLYPGQMLFLVTDGVSDCFDGDELPEYINGLSAVNPERASAELLRRALKACGDEPRDDMTVIAFRLFENRQRMFGLCA